jgi:cytochrome P450
VTIGGGVLTAECDEHKRQRRILTPAFGVAHLRKIAPIFWQKANELVEVLDVKVQSQPFGGIDLTQSINRATLDIIGLAGCLSLFVQGLRYRLWL